MWLLGDAGLGVGLSRLERLLLVLGRDFADTLGADLGREFDLLLVADLVAEVWDELADIGSLSFVGESSGRSAGWG